MNNKKTYWKILSEQKDMWSKFLCWLHKKNKKSHNAKATKSLYHLLLVALAVFLLIPLMSGETLREENNNLIEKALDLGTKLVSNPNETINNSEINIEEDMINPFLPIGIVIVIILMFLFFKLYKSWDGDYQE